MIPFFSGQHKLWKSGQSFIQWFHEFSDPRGTTVVSVEWRNFANLTYQIAGNCSLRLFQRFFKVVDQTGDWEPGSMLKCAQKTFYSLCCLQGVLLCNKNYRVTTETRKLFSSLLGQKRVFFQLFLAKKYIFFQPLVTKNIIYSSLIYKLIHN